MELFKPTRVVIRIKKFHEKSELGKGGGKGRDKSRWTCEVARIAGKGGE